MSVRFRLLPVALALLAAAPDPARAWGDEGHQVIGTLAYKRLTPKARKAVDELLRRDKDTLTKPDFVSRTTWADKYRDSDRWGAQKRYRATREWHFVDVQLEGGSLAEACFGRPPLAEGTPASAGPAQACVVDKIEQFRAELANPATPRAERILALKFVMHFVGDVHQPLHAADHHDGGGNGVTVQTAPGNSPSTLHGYWDTTLVRKIGSTVALASARIAPLITPARAAAWSQGSVEDWAAESFRRAKETAYDFAGEKPIVDDHGGTGELLDAAYEAKALPVAREALAQAAVRLAALLNDALK